MAQQAAIQADQFIKTGSTGKPEKQSIDMVLITPENYCQYKTFAPTGSTASARHRLVRRPLPRRVARFV